MGRCIASATTSLALVDTRSDESLELIELILWTKDETPPIAVWKNDIPPLSPLTLPPEFLLPPGRGPCAHDLDEREQLRDRLPMEVAGADRLALQRLDRLSELSLRGLARREVHVPNRIDSEPARGELREDNTVRLELDTAVRDVDDVGVDVFERRLCEADDALTLTDDALTLTCLVDRVVLIFGPSHWTTRVDHLIVDDRLEALPCARILTVLRQMNNEGREIAAAV